MTKLDRLLQASAREQESIRCLDADMINELAARAHELGLDIPEPTLMSADDCEKDDVIFLVSATGNKKNMIMGYIPDDFQRLYSGKELLNYVYGSND